MELALPASRIIPANFGELTAYDTHDNVFGIPYGVRVWEKSAPETILFSGEIAGKEEPYVALDASFQPGNRYVFELTPRCHPVSTPEPPPPKLVEVEVGPVASPPTTLGSLELVNAGRENIPLMLNSFCTGGFEAGVADVRLDLQTLPEPWRDALTNYQLIVDGEPFTWTAGLGAGNSDPDYPRAKYAEKPGDFRAWTACEPEPEDTTGAYPVKGLKPGKHEVWVRARVPSDEPHTIESQHVTVNLSCNLGKQKKYGCSVAPGQSQSSPVLPALLASGMLVAYQVRRRRRS